jgi:hypothetical protein
MTLPKKKDPNASFSATQPAALVPSRPAADLRRAAVASDVWRGRMATCDNPDTGRELAERGQR